MGESQARYALVAALAKRVAALRRIPLRSGRVVRSYTWSVARLALRQAGPEVEQAALEGGHSVISDKALLAAWEEHSVATADGALKAKPVGVSGDDNLNH